MSENGVRKLRGFMRKPDEDRQNQKEFAGSQEGPWEAVPGRHHIDVKANFAIPQETHVITREPPAREMKPRRIHIKRSVVSDKSHGLTPGRKACQASNRGLVGIHNERCRQRIEGQIKEYESGRYNKVLDKLGMTWTMAAMEMQQ